MVWSKPLLTVKRDSSMPEVLDPSSNFSIQRINGSIVIRPQQAEAPVATAYPLTRREQGILSLVAEGYSNKQVGACLNISERTVKNHLSNIMAKLQAYDRTHAVVTAVRLGWLAI